LEEDDEHRLEHIIPLQNTTPSNSHDQTSGYKIDSATHTNWDKLKPTTFKL